MKTYSQNFFVDDAHYKDLKYQIWDFEQYFHFGYTTVATLKYLLRDKKGVRKSRDLAQALNCLDRLRTLEIKNKMIKQVTSHLDISEMYKHKSNQIISIISHIFSEKPSSFSKAYNELREYIKNDSF